jgi:hypothetical protein
MNLCIECSYISIYLKNISGKNNYFWLPHSGFIKLLSSLNSVIKYIEFYKENNNHNNNITGPHLNRPTDGTETANSTLPRLTCSVNNQDPLSKIKVA